MEKKNKLCPLVSSHMYYVTNLNENKHNKPTVWHSASPPHKSLQYFLFSLFLDLSSRRPKKIQYLSVGACKEHNWGHVYLIMETGVDGAEGRKTRFLYVAFTVVERKIQAFLSFFLSLFLVHKHTARTKCTVIKAVSIHYVVKGGREMIDAHMN